MEELNPFQRKMNNTKLKLSDLNPHLMCVLCGGYYIDATTIVECLHSFCRSCIVKYLERNKYCPICEVQVHKTKPLINIRPDKSLQNIVYKLVPGLYSNEMRNRRKFYKGQPQNLKPTDSEAVGEMSEERKIYINDEHITFSLVYHLGSMSTCLENDYKEITPPSQFQNDKRYFKCPTGVTINHLKKLLRAKYDLSDNNYKVEVYFRDQMLHEEYTLLDIAYMYLWKAKGNLDLTFKIFENVVKRQKIEEKENEKNEILKENTRESKANSFPGESQPEIQESKNDAVQVAQNINGEKERVAKDEEETKSTAALPSMTEVKVVNMDVTDSQKPGFYQVKENGVSPSDTKEVQLQISESGVMSVSQVEDGAIVRTVEDSVLKVVNSQMMKSECVNKSAKGNGEVKKPEAVNRFLAEPQKKPPAKPVKPYKTIRCSPKTWHPVIPKEKLRPTLMKNSDEPKKPLKFFKMRNMPRFLGNPSSGVKPMYGETPESNAEEKKKPQEKKMEATKNKILKIDPKTLRPIEKEEMKVAQATPNVPNLLTNPFIPNNNHFLFSDLHLLPPNAGNYSNSKMDPKLDKSGTGGFKCPLPNGTYPPICFPSPEHSPGFHPFTNLKPHSFPFPINSKMDPLLRASRLSPFGNLTGFNVAGFHASLPPSISRLLNPHHHFRKINQSLEKKNKEESTKETNRVCDDSIKIGKTKEEEKEEKKSVEDNQESSSSGDGGSAGGEENGKRNECKEEKNECNSEKVTEEKSGKKSGETKEKAEERKTGENSESASQRTDTKPDPVTNNSDSVKVIDKEKER